MEKLILTPLFEGAKKCIKDNRPNEARDLCDMGIAHLANLRIYEDIDLEDDFEGIKVGTWLKRFWNFLENHDLLLDETTIENNYYD
jgi:hypothetical protein